MIYLFIGEDVEVKDQKIEAIKKKVLNKPDAINFDYEILHAPKLDPADLKKALVTLPTIAKNRLILIRQASKLSKHHKELIQEFADLNQSDIVLIIDFELTEEYAFIKKLSSVAEVFRSSSQKKNNVFDMTNAISAQKPREALQILNNLLKKGDHPLQIMGALVWFWGKMKNRLSQDKYKTGLLELQEADLNIKRSRLKPEYTVEVLVVKLCSLVAC